MAHNQESLIILAASVTGSGGNVTVTGLDATNSYVLPTVTPGDTFYYSILTDGAGNWEYGSGSWVSTGNGTTTFGTFARTGVIKSKAGVATPANFSGSPVTMIFDIPAEKAIFLDPSNNIVNGDLVANAVNVLDFATLVAKKVPTVTNVIFRVSYGRTQGDGLGGFFIWKSGDGTAADDHTSATTVNTIAPAVGTGRYLRLFEAFVPATVAADANIPNGGIAALTGTDELRRQRATVGPKAIPQVENYYQGSYATLAALLAVASSKWRNNDRVQVRGIVNDGDIKDPLDLFWNASDTDTSTALNVNKWRPDDISGANQGRWNIALPNPRAKFADSDATPDVSGGEYFQCADTVPAAITTFDNMRENQRIVVYPGAQNQIFSHSSSFVMPGAVDFLLSTTDAAVTFEKIAGVISLIGSSIASSELLGETFGMIGDGLDANATANTTAFGNFISALDAFTSPSGRLGEGDFRIEGALIDTKRGFEIDGQGTGDLARTGTTLRWKDASSTGAMIDLRSTHSIFMEGFRFRSGSQTGKDSAIISTANESPALSNLRTVLRDCAFQTDSPTSFASGFLNLKSSANTSIHASQFVGGTGLKIGKDADVDPDTSNATLANGISSDIDTQNNIFVADIKLENCYNWTSFSDYFGLNPSTNTIAKISCTGLEEARSLVFINPMIDPAGTSGNAAIWFDGPTNSSGDHGPVVAIGGQFTGADIAFNLPNGFGAVMGGKFVATNTPTAGIVLGPNFAGDIEPFTNNDFTDLMAAGVPAIDDQRSTHKFADADTTPSLLAGQKHQIADNPPTGGYSDFDDVIEGRHYTLAAGGSKSTKLNNGTSIGGPANETWYMAPGDAPVEVVPLGGKNYIFPLAPPRRSFGVYSEQTAQISSGRITPNKPQFIIASEVAGAPDNLVNIDLEAENAFVFKRGSMLSARINSVDEPITILASGNIHTWNGKPATLTDPNKVYWFRINSDGQGMTLMSTGLDAFELNNEPLGANDVGVIFFFGQSNQNIGVATTTSATLTHVDMMTTGGFAWAQYTTASSPYQNNCHVEQTTRFAGPYDSFAKLWESNQAAWSLPHLYAGLAAQGGEPFSAKNANANKSKWNPDRLISQGDGSPDPTTDGYYRSRFDGENVASPKYSLYDLAADMIRKGLDAIEATGKRPRLLGVVWVHGETDSTNTTMANEYARHLAQLYDHLAAAAGVDDLPFFVSQVASQNYAQRAIVNAAMTSFAETKRMVRVLDPTTLPSYNAGDTGGSPPNLGVFVDGIHYTQAANDDIADWVWAQTVGRRFYGVVTGKAKRRKRDPRLLFSAFYVPGGAYDSATQAAFVWNNIIRDDLELYNTGGSSDDSILIPWDGDYEIEISGLQSSESTKVAASELKIYLNGDPDTNPSGDATFQLKRAFMNKDTSGGQLQRNCVAWRGALAAGDRIYGVYQGYLHTSSVTDKDHMITVKYLGEN